MRQTRDNVAMKRIWLIFTQTTTVLLAVYFVVLTLKPHWLAGHPSLATASSNRLPGGGEYSNQQGWCRSG
jgi:hypothetical protein